MEVSKLFIYPIKSLPGIQLQASNVDLKGLQFDRRFVLVDENNTFISQREYIDLLKFRCEIRNQKLMVSFIPDNSELEIDIEPEIGEKIKIKIWDDEIFGTRTSNYIDDWFGSKLGITCKLIFQASNDHRKIDSKFGVNGYEETSFSDAYPILVISEESLEHLNEICPEAIEMERFRPNIVVKNCGPHAEDNLKVFFINNVKFVGVKPCARCIMTTINTQNLIMTKEPLKTLSTYRKIGNKILFGQNVIVHSVGNIEVGSKIQLYV